jgi:hypothetical protein
MLRHGNRRSSFTQQCVQLSRNALCCKSVWAPSVITGLVHTWAFFNHLLLLCRSGMPIVGEIQHISHVGAAHFAYRESIRTSTGVKNDSVEEIYYFASVDSESLVPVPRKV